MKAEIRRTKDSSLYGAYASAACFLAALLIFGSEGAILLLGAASMFVYIAGRRLLRSIPQWSS